MRSFVNKKKFVGFAGVGLCVGLVAGCGSESDEPLGLQSGPAVVEDFKFEASAGNNVELAGSENEAETSQGVDPDEEFPDVGEGDRVPEELADNVLSSKDVDVEADLGGDLNAMPNDKRSGGGASNAGDVVVEGNVAGFSAEELKDAFTWSTDMVGYGYSYSGFWNADGGVVDPGAYWVYSGFVEPKVWEDSVVPKLIGQEELDANKEFFDKLAPRPPRVDGVWASPAVGGFMFGEPRFSAGSKSGELIVEFPYEASAVYNDSEGQKFWSVPVEANVRFGLVRGDTPAVEGGKWLLTSWASSGTSVPTFGSGVELGFVPNDRLPGYPVEGGISGGSEPELVELTPEEIEEIDELNRELYGSGG